MPASELLALADRWREDPARAARDGQLLATTRAALASLDGAERATIARELRSHGAQELADRLTAVEGLPVWSDDVTAVARDLLGVDAATLQDLRAAVDPDALAAAVRPPSGEPVTDLPPPAPAVDAPDGGDRTAPDVAELPDVDLEGADVPAPAGAVREHGGWRPSAWQPRGSAPSNDAHLGDGDAWDGTDGTWDETDGTWDETEATWDEADGTDAHAPTGARDDATADAEETLRAPGQDRAPGSGRRASDDRHAPLGPRDPGHRAPGQRDATRARDRFRALGAVGDGSGTDVDDAVTLLRDAPDGWQRRRVASRLIAARLPVDAEAVLPLLGREGDRAAVADRLVRRGTATLDEVTPWLSDATARRLARRHGAR